MLRSSLSCDTGGRSTEFSCRREVPLQPGAHTDFDCPNRALCREGSTHGEETLSPASATTNRDFFDPATTFVGVERQGFRGVAGLIRSVVLALAVGLGPVVLGSCGPASSAAQWAKVSAQTCRSTIARAHLKDPSNAQVAPERFLDERRRLLDGHRGFNTVTAFRAVCSRVRQELIAPGPDETEATVP